MPRFNKEEDEKAKAKTILEALDDTIAKDLWTKSNFLKAISKELFKIRESLVQFIGAREDAAFSSGSTGARSTLHGNQQEIYISLYSSEGSQMQSWERIISNLPRQMISRPVYIQEEDAQSWIKHKENKLNEGYVCILVSTSSLLELSEDKKPKDKFGKPLLVLKDRSIDLNNIQKFVHVSGHYVYSQGRLQKI